MRELAFAIPNRRKGHVCRSYSFIERPPAGIRDAWQLAVTSNSESASSYIRERIRDCYPAPRQECDANGGAPSSCRYHPPAVHVSGFCRFGPHEETRCWLEYKVGGACTSGWRSTGLSLWLLDARLNSNHWLQGKGWFDDNALKAFSNTLPTPPGLIQQVSD